MASQLTALLIEEHQIISSAGELVFELAEVIEHHPEKYKKTILELLEFFKIYSDEYHHFKEEQVLFPAMTVKNELIQSGIVAELEEHHELFREYVQTIRTALKEDDLLLAQATLERYLHELKEHIAVEDDELFVMADELLPESELENLYYRCQDIDRELGIERKMMLSQKISGLRSEIREYI